MDIVNLDLQISYSIHQKHIPSKQNLNIFLLSCRTKMEKSTVSGVIFNQHPIRNKRISPLTTGILIAIILIGAFLRFYQLGANNLGNLYYAATVKSMLTSLPNFFFGAFEPGGSVTVDKPPVGFWIEALSAYLLGFSGFALAFPNALAGTLAIPLLYALVCKQFGKPAGLTSALVLAITPLTIATERNNTIDGMLVFILLLSASAAWKSIETGKLRYLLLAFLMIGLGFNIKMLQAYMVLPAVFGLYFIGAKHHLPQKISHLILATFLLFLISFSWSVVDDSIPAGNRPYIGSSSNNSVIELIVGHNGLKRIFQGPGPGQMPGNPGEGLQQPIPQNSPGGPDEVGIPGQLRLFIEPLTPQVSWLLPLALIGLVLVLISPSSPADLNKRQEAAFLWGSWLIPTLAYFSFTKGLWHIYYLIMLGPPIAAFTGASIGTLGFIAKQGNQTLDHNSNRQNQIATEVQKPDFQQNFRFTDQAMKMMMVAVSGLMIGYEAFVLSAHPIYFIPLSIVMLSIWLIGMITLWAISINQAIPVIMLSLLISPLSWSGLTSFNKYPDVNLPRAAPAQAAPGNSAPDERLDQTQQISLTYLTHNTQPGNYLAATLDSHGASPYILASGRPFLTLGGFNRHDTVVTLSQLQKMISDRKLRFVLDNGSLTDKKEIHDWVVSNCKTIQIPSLQTPKQTIASARELPAISNFPHCMTVPLIQKFTKLINQIRSLLCQKPDIADQPL